MSQLKYPGGGVITERGPRLQYYFWMPSRPALCFAGLKYQQQAGNFPELTSWNRNGVQCQVRVQHYHREHLAGTHFRASIFHSVPQMVQTGMRHWLGETVSLDAWNNNTLKIPTNAEFNNEPDYGAFLQQRSIARNALINAFPTKGTDTARRAKVSSVALFGTAWTLPFHSSCRVSMAAEYIQALPTQIWSTSELACKLKWVRLQYTLKQWRLKFSNFLSGCRFFDSA